MNNDAKSAWMRQVKKHRKGQKGLPALSSLNPNAGNVEHNINMFNMMQPDSSISVDAASGNVFAEVGTSMGEALEPTKLPETIELEYTKLPVELVINQTDAYYSDSFGNWLPGDYDTVLRKITWVYNAPTDSVIDYLLSSSEVVEKFDAEDMSDEEFIKLVEDNLDDLVDEFNDELLKWFEDDAIADAQDNFKESFEIEHAGNAKKPLVEHDAVDDIFDMSMRTLL